MLSIAAGPLASLVTRSELIERGTETEIGIEIVTENVTGMVKSSHRYVV